FSNSLTPGWFDPIGQCNGGAPTTPLPSEIPAAGQIDYSALIHAAAGRMGEELIASVAEEAVYASHDAYLALTPRPTEIARISQGAFECVYDDYASMEARGFVPRHPTMEARLVLAIGRSAPRLPKRDDSRLRVGGVVDGFKLNVFVQRRSLNRGWKSHPGGRGELVLTNRLYRQMEEYCAANAGTFCFIRPIYGDETAKPTLLEFGILKPGRYAMGRSVRQSIDA